MDERDLLSRGGSWTQRLWATHVYAHRMPETKRKQGRKSEVEK